MKPKYFFLVILTGCFLLFSFQSEAQKSNILIEKGLAYLASTQSTSKGYEPGQGTSIDPENVYEMSKTAGDWGGAGITSLALQAFLQNGHNIDDPVYGTVVTNAINYLLGMQTLTGDYAGRIGTWSEGYETAMAIEAFHLALVTPISAGGLITGTLRTNIEDAIDLAVNYYTQDINVAWNAVSWRYNRYYTSEYGGDMSVNQWVYLALDAVNYEDKGVWSKIYTYLNGKKCVSGTKARVGYQDCNTRPQGMTCAGSWGAVLAADHGVVAATALKTQFYNYLEGFSLAQLINPGSIGDAQIYSGGGYYYYLYGFAKAMSLNFLENFAGGNWYNTMYTAIEGQHFTDGSGNYYWNQWGGQGANMETALALLCLQTKSIPVGSTLVISLSGSAKEKDDCLEITINDQLGNSAGNAGGTWYTNIPNSEWISTTPGAYEFSVVVLESSNYSGQILNTCLGTQSAEICYATYQEGVQTDEECYQLDEILPFTPIGMVGFVNAIGGLNVIIVVPPAPIPVMQLTPGIIGINPFEYSQTFNFSFDISETGGESPLLSLDIFASDLTDQFGNVISANQIGITPGTIDLILAGETETVEVTLTTPATLPFNPGLFEGIITIQTPTQVKGFNIELGSPDMMIDPDAVVVSPTNGSTAFNIDFTGMIGAAWEISYTADWIVADPLTGNGDGTVTVNYLANSGDLERTAEITIAAPGALNPEETFTITQEAAPYPFFTNIELMGSEDMNVWWNADGSYEEGFRIALDYNLPEYYLNLGSETATNVPLALGLYPFYLNPATVPPDFYNYWEGRGVVDGATGWQGIMWEIINGNQPTFYIKVEPAKAQTFSLIDGLQYLFAGLEVYLQVPGDYPLGNYGYSGFVESEPGETSEQIDVMILFYRASLLEAELLVSQDQILWESAFGNLQDGYMIRLDDMVANYYLNLGANTMSNYPLATDMFPFFLDTDFLPAGFYDYWSARGVVDGATGWQGIMWEIINGNQPTFYIKVDNEPKDQIYSLVDGLQFLFAGLETYLTVPGNYLLGNYTYKGFVVDEYEVPSDEMSIMITFASDVDQQIELMPGWLGISSYIIPEDPALEAVMLGIENDMTIMLGKNGIFWPSKNINTIGNWNSYEGYKMKVIQPTLLELFGYPTEKTLDIPAGICYMPMLSPDPLDNQIFADMGDALEYAFNIQDQLVYWPAGHLYTLETLEPGVGYLIKLTAPVTVDFTAKSAVNSQIISSVENNSPWNDVHNSGNAHIISIDQKALEVLAPGDYIGVFDANGEIAGITEFKGEPGNLQLIVFGDDITTAAKDGFAEGELMNFLGFRIAGQQVCQLQVTFDTKYTQGEFQSAGLSRITNLKFSALGMNGQIGDNFRIYPNPASGQLHISSGESCGIIIINAAGQVVLTSAITGNTILDISTLEKGIYFLKASNEKGLSVQKLVIE